MTGQTNRLGTNVTRKLSTRIQPEHIEMVKSTAGASATIKALQPMSQDPATGLWIPWAPTSVSTIYNKLRGFLWPYDYDQGAESKIISVMTAGVIPIDEILGNGDAIWASAAPSPDDFYYVGFLRDMRDPALRSDSLHITGMGEILYV